MSGRLPRLMHIVCGRVEQDKEKQAGWRGGGVRTKPALQETAHKLQVASAGATRAPCFVGRHAQATDLNVVFEVRVALGRVIHNPNML